MTFSEKCTSYIAAHSCAERIALDLVRKALPVTSSTIDWSRVPGKEEINDVERASLSAELTRIVNSIGGEMSDIFYVVNIDEAFPALKTSLSEWLRFVGELDFVDTIFVSEPKKIIIHWDFYKNLHATVMS